MNLETRNQRGEEEEEENERTQSSDQEILMNLEKV